MRVALLRIVLIAITVLSTEASRADEIVLGVSTPMTGPAAPFVQGVLDGVRMAVGEINARGGISQTASACCVRRSMQSRACRGEYAANDPAGQSRGTHWIFVRRYGFGGIGTRR